MLEMNAQYTFAGERMPTQVIENLAYINNWNFVDFCCNMHLKNVEVGNGHRKYYCFLHYFIKSNQGGEARAIWWPQTRQNKPITEELTPEAHIFFELVRTHTILLKETVTLFNH